MFPVQSLTRLRETLSSFPPGSKVAVNWKSQAKDSLLYPPGGTVAGVTERLIVLRSPVGFRFCVSINDLASGAGLRRA
ncbi:hypothetical protein [Ammonifex thiophilus]|uniref:Uncharacterized protein n=1 Tax=Ammonifex thiophilus TaxID=444093 RepID=A0A3D8P6B8_9THEO|nr:hypothetical protein [Ammonifex thiophilus]RDV83904.1 hypothetical protein DXX99_03455 [Ammonifex thiophilus]